jgi:hypothetical protein
VPLSQKLRAGLETALGAILVPGNGAKAAVVWLPAGVVMGVMFTLGSVALSPGASSLTKIPCHTDLTIQPASNLSLELQSKLVCARRAVKLYILFSNVDIQQYVYEVAEKCARHGDLGKIPGTDERGESGVAHGASKNSTDTAGTGHGTVFRPSCRRLSRELLLTEKFAAVI